MPTGFASTPIVDERRRGYAFTATIALDRVVEAIAHRATASAPAGGPDVGPWLDWFEVEQESGTVISAAIITPTPTRAAEEEQIRSKEYQREVGTGGAAAFLRVVREELIPDIERRYRTNGDGTFIGYSLGGLFGIYTLFHQPETFQRMVLVSPSVFWDGNVVYKYEEADASAHKSLPVRLFMSMGEGENDTMIGPMRRLENAMRSRRYDGLHVTTRIFTGERHLSTFPVAMTRGLRPVFADATLQ